MSTYNEFVAARPDVVELSDDQFDAVFRDVFSTVRPMAPVHDPEQSGVDTSGSGSPTRRRFTVAMTAAAAVIMVIGLVVIAGRDTSPSPTSGSRTAVGEPSTTASSIDLKGVLPIAEGRTGGPLPDQSCTWTLRPMGAINRGVTLESVFADGSNGTSAFPDDPDDVVWIQQLTFCVDAPTFVFGGVSDDVGSVVLTSQNAEQVVLEVLDVPNEDWGAVIGEIPRSWRSLGSFRVEAISKHDGTVLASESY